MSGTDLVKAASEVAGSTPDGVSGITMVISAAFGAAGTVFANWIRGRRRAVNDEANIELNRDKLKHEALARDSEAVRQQADQFRDLMQTELSRLRQRNAEYETLVEKLRDEKLSLSSELTIARAELRVASVRFEARESESALELAESRERISALERALASAVDAKAEALAAASNFHPTSEDIGDG